MPVLNAATSPWSATGRASSARPAAAPLAAVEHAWRSVPAYPRGLTVEDLVANHRRQLWLLRRRLRRRRLLRRRSSKTGKGVGQSPQALAPLPNAFRPPVGHFLHQEIPPEATFKNLCS